MNRLLESVYTILSEQPIKVYLEVPKEKAPYPYVVFRLPQSVSVESDRHDYILQIDIWDSNTDTTTLESITSNVDALLYRRRYIDEHYLLIFEREAINMVTDPDPTIRRRQIRYVMKTYERQ